MKYTSAGGSIHLAVEHEEQWAKVVVKDTGIGIPTEALSHIFDRFYRVDKARSLTMTLGGLAIAIGEVVDDAIIDVENIYRRLRENRRLFTPRLALQVVYEASVEVRSSVVYASFIVALVVLPLFFMSGVQGRIFTPLGAAYLLSILASLGVALGLLPLALSGERAGQEIEHPMAVVILGGLLTSTVLNLFVVPALYLRWGDERTNS